MLSTQSFRESLKNLVSTPEVMEAGEEIPEFMLKNQDGEGVSSHDIDDAVIYFYPKASTPGCREEACNFRDSIKEFETADVDVYGVSTDSVAVQKKFHDGQDLNFDLLADEDKEVARKFGVLRRTGFADRTTFLVKDGVIEKVFRNVDPGGHVEEVLDYIG